MKRILSIGGAVLAFSVAALVYLTAGAASGDIVCIRPNTNAGLASGAVKTELAAAISATAGGIVPANLDWVECGHRPPKAPGVWFCTAGEEIALNDAQWAAADIAGVLGDATPTAEYTKVYGPKKLDAAMMTAWGNVTQAAFAVPLDSVRSMRFSRQNPGNETEVTMEWAEITILTPTAYKAARTADPPTCGRGIGVVE